MFNFSIYFDIKNLKGKEKKVEEKKKGMIKSGIKLTIVKMGTFGHFLILDTC